MILLTSTNFGKRKLSGDWARSFLGRSSQYSQWTLCDRFGKRLVDEFHPEALAEFEEAAKYYEAQKQGLGHEVLTAVH